MTKTKTAPNKSAVIRQALELLGKDASAKDVIAKCKALGVDVKPNLISNVKMAIHQASKKPVRKKVTATLAKAPVAHTNGAVPPSLDKLLSSAKVLVCSLGSVDKAVAFVKGAGPFLS